MLVRFRSSSGIAGVFTDRTGNFSVAALPDLWNVELLEDSGMFRAGYMHVRGASPGEPVLDTRSGNIPFYSINASPGTAMIYGQITNTLGYPLAGVPFFTSGTDPTNYFESFGLSDTNGNYGSRLKAWAHSISPG